MVRNTTVIVQDFPPCDTSIAGSASKAPLAAVHWCNAQAVSLRIVNASDALHI